MHIHNPLLLLAACLLITATANTGIPADSTVPQMLTPAGALLDSYIEFFNPNVSISEQQSNRDGRTTLTVTLSSRAQVSKHMPVVSPQVQGTTMDILDTWDALKVRLTIKTRCFDDQERLAAVGNGLMHQGVWQLRSNRRCTAQQHMWHCSTRSCSTRLL